jgi:hypothetical protein
MPSALSFTSQDQIVAALKKRRWQDDLDKAHRKLTEDLGPLTAIYRSVGSSTYRPFRKHGKYTPSLVFRTWASEELFNGALAQLGEIRSNDQYRMWAKRLARRLSLKWLEQLKYELDLPRALKLVNLLAKGLCIVSPLWPKRHKAVVGISMYLWISFPFGLFHVSQPLTTSICEMPAWVP